MTMTTIRLILRQHRFAFTTLVSVLGVLIVGCGGMFAWLSLGTAHECLSLGAAAALSMPSDRLQALTTQCPGIVDYARTVSAGLGGFAILVPPVAALFVAAPLVAVEVENGTATLAWALARSRRAWLAPRVVLVAGIVMAMTVMVALLLDGLRWRIELEPMSQSPWASFADYPNVGAILVARTMVVVGAGLASGALLGRQVPALVLGGLLTLLITLGFSGLDDQLNHANAGPISDGRSGLVLDTKYRVLATGELLNIWELPEADQDPSTPGWDTRYTWVSIGLEDSQAPLVVGRNLVFHGGAALALVGLTFVVVERRRPYLS